METVIDSFHTSRSSLHSEPTPPKRGIAQARQAISTFFVDELGRDASCLRFMKLARVETGWEARVEVTEENLYLKKLNYPPVYDKNIYIVALDESLEVVGYSQEEESQEG